MRAWMVLLAGVLAFVVWSTLMVFWASRASPVAERRMSITGKATESAERRSAANPVPLAALELRPTEGGLLLSGELPNAAAAAELLSKAQVMYAPLPVQDGLRIRPESAQSAWLGEALAVLPLPMPGVERPEWLLSAEGLRIGGVASDSTVRDAVRAQLAQRFPRLPLSDQLQLAAGAEREAPTPAAALTTVAAQSPPPISETVAPDPLPPNPAEPAGAGVAAGSGPTRHPRQAEVDALLKARPVVFASGSTRLRRGEGPDWRALAKLLADSGIASVSVRGHTDDRGSADGNRRLSARRAEAVRQALIRAGVAAARIRVEGVGAAEPVASNRTAAGRRQNRRIELRLQAGAGA